MLKKPGSVAFECPANRMESKSAPWQMPVPSKGCFGQQIQEAGHSMAIHHLLTALTLLTPPAHCPHKQQHLSRPEQDPWAPWTSAE